MNQNNSVNHKLIKGCVIFVSIILLVIVSSIIHFLNRGFELTDETFFLYFSNYYFPTHYNTTNFGLINKLACFGNPTLINLRIAKLGYQLIAVIFFIWSLFKYLDYKSIQLSNQQKTILFLLITITSFGHYDYLPMTLSYNAWSLILTLFCFGFIF